MKKSKKKKKSVFEVIVTDKNGKVKEKFIGKFIKIGESNATNKSNSR